MKKILVVLTGGTIGSRVENDVIDVSGTSPYRLLSLYEEAYGEEAFDVMQPINILSENMTPELLLTLLKALERIPYEKYAGIIVAHGSDTLSYTAAFAGLLFHSVSIPMILIASNYPLGQEGSNGLNNFARAVELIRGERIGGVFVIYQDREGIDQVYLATRIHEAEPVRDQFRDFSGCAFGRMEHGRLLLQTKNAAGESRPVQEKGKENGEIKLTVPDSFANKVMLIRPYPGMDYSVFRFDEKNKPAAVLHYLYHSATACLAGGEYDFLSFVKRCRELDIDVYTASHKRTEGKQYATGEALLRAGVVPLLNISPEAAYAKLMLLYNGKSRAERALVRENIYFECIECGNE